VRHRSKVKESRRKRRREERLRAIVHTAIRARALPPEETLAVGFDLVSFAEKLRNAATPSDV
jgi:hypothetical protein